MCRENKWVKVSNYILYIQNATCVVFLPHKRTSQCTYKLCVFNMLANKCISAIIQLVISYEFN